MGIILSKTGATPTEKNRTDRPKRSAMTAPHSEPTGQKRRQRFVLPDPPEREPEDMTSFDHLTLSGSVHHLVQHLGKPETTIVAGERYVVPGPGRNTQPRRIPDLLIAFDADPQAYKENNGYIIFVQGKPPDFVLEIASPSTAEIDTVDKPKDYAALGIPEYWRFDETGHEHGVRLAGDRLVDDHYEPIPIEEIQEGILQGYSASLNLILRWDHGELRWYDPATSQHIVTYDTLVRRADSEQEARLAAEARVRELEAEMERRDRQG